MCGVCPDCDLSKVFLLLTPATPLDPDQVSVDKRWMDGWVMRRCAVDDWKIHMNSYSHHVTVFVFK